VDVLYEDYHLLAVNKSAPLLTQAPAGIPSLEAAAKAYLKEKYQKPAGVYLAVPHRLDRPVSGAVLFARNTKAAQRVQAQFEARTVAKVYWALVEGAVADDAGVWADWVRKVPDEPRAGRAAEGEPGAKFAELAFQVLDRRDGSTLLELTPRTGRMHQLRVQSAWRGHPVMGDVSYGSTTGFGPEAAEPRDRVIALHALRLTLAHPFTAAELVLTAPPPDYWPAAWGGALDTPAGSGK